MVFENPTARPHELIRRKHAKVGHS